MLPLLLLLINCRHATTRADQAICAAPELRAIDRQIDQQTATLKAKLDPADAAMLSDTDMPFQRERNNCSNHEDVAPCVRNVLNARLAVLTRAASDPSVLREAIDRAKYIDIDFLWKYWPQLLGRRLFVFGCILPDDNEKTRAVLETENHPPVPLLFKSMPEGTAEFLDDQKPCAHWTVTVRKEDGKLLLYADEVLGRPLP